MICRAVIMMMTGRPYLYTSAARTHSVLEKSTVADWEAGGSMKAMVQMMVYMQAS